MNDKFEYQLVKKGEIVKISSHKFAKLVSTFNQCHIDFGIMSEVRFTKDMKIFTQTINLL